MRDRRLAYPAECETGEGDTDLRARDIVIEILNRFLELPRSEPARRRDLFHPASAHADERELCGDEKTVQDDKPEN